MTIYIVYHYMTFRLEGAYENEAHANGIADALNKHQTGKVYRVKSCPLTLETKPAKVKKPR